MKEYKIPVSWRVRGYVTIKSDTRKHAAEIAESDMGLGLPDNGQYQANSWKVDWDLVQREIENK